MPTGTGSFRGRRESADAVVFAAAPDGDRLDELHVGRSLRKAERRSGFHLHDRSGRSMTSSPHARDTRGDETGTWIGGDHRRVPRPHRAGDAHSVEVWRDDEVVGVCTELMPAASHRRIDVSSRPDASKLALLFLIEHLRACGASWLDCQVMTPHMEAPARDRLRAAVFWTCSPQSRRGDLAFFDHAEARRGGGRTGFSALRDSA